MGDEGTAVDITKLLEKAREAAERRNYDYAIELYLQACNLSPDSVEARRELRAVENRVFKERGLSFGGKLKSIINAMKGGFQMLFKKYEAAMQSAEDRLKADPGNTSALLTLGRAAKAANYRQAAIATFEDVTASRGGGNTKVYVQACRELAYLYEEEGRIAEALERWSDVSKNVPGGDREAAQKSRDLSAKSMSQQIETGTTGGQKGSISLGIARDREKKDKLERSGQQIRTAEDLAAAIKDTLDDTKTSPDDARVWGKLGDLQKQGEKYEDSKKAYETAIEKDATNPHWRFKLDDLEIWRLSREFNEVAKKFKAGDGSLKEQVTQKRQEVLDLRLKSFTEREKNYSTDSRIKFELGNIYFDIAEVRKDLELYDQAIMRFQQTFRDPKYRVQSGLRMGLGFSRKEQYDLALKRFDETLNTLELKDESWKNLTYAKGDTLEKSGQFQDGLAAFLAIYEVDVAFKDVSKRVETLQTKVKEQSGAESGD